MGRHSPRAASHGARDKLSEEQTLKAKPCPQSKALPSEAAWTARLNGSPNAGHSRHEQLKDQLERESQSLALWNSFEPISVKDPRRKTFNVRSEMITRCKLNIQKYRETIAALEEQTGG